MAPAAMERASSTAYELPSAAIVKPRVANATEGAAPNSPAKFLGLSELPSAAKAETTRPPTQNRSNRTFSRSALHPNTVLKGRHLINKVARGRDERGYLAAFLRQAS